MHRRHWMGSFLLCLVAVPILPIQLAAEDDPKQVDPKAQAVLRKLSEHLQTLRSFSVEMRMSMDAKGPGVKQKYDAEHKLTARKPDKLALISGGGIIGHTIVYDGKTVYTKDPMTGESGTSTPPGDGGLDSLSLNYLAPGMPHESIAVSIIKALVASDPYPKFLPSGSTLAYLGTQKVDGVECHKLKVGLSVKGSWYLFVNTSEKPLIRRVEPDTSDVPKGMPGMKMELSIDFRGWKLNIECPDKQFQMPSSDEASKVTSRPTETKGKSKTTSRPTETKGKK